MPMIPDANQQIYYLKPPNSLLEMAKLQKRIAAAIEVFVRGYSAGLSLTHPYECLKIEDVWAMRDAPRRNPRYYRKEEWVAYRVDPAKVDSVARRNTRGRFFICAIQEIDEPNETVRADYKRIGYRLLRTEPLFVHDLTRIPRLKSPAKVLQVKSQEMAERFGKATRTRPISRELLTKPVPFRQYVAVDEQVIVG